MDKRSDASILPLCLEISQGDLTKSMCRLSYEIAF